MLLVITLVASCDSPGPGRSPGVEVRDSAGVEIVEHEPAPVSTAVSLELIWEHGHGPDDYPFQSVFLGALQPDGGAVVADGGNQEVVAIGPLGSSQVVLATTGQGPSEVMRPRSILVVGQDTLWVEDPGNGKLIRFEGGTLASTISTRGEATLARGLMPQGVDASGRFLMTTSSFRSDFEQAWFEGQMVRFDPSAHTLDTVGSYQMAPRRPEGGLNPYSPFGIVAAQG